MSFRYYLTFMWFLPRLKYFPHIQYMLISTLLNVQGVPLKIFKVLCEALISLVPCPENSSHLGFPGLSTPSSQVCHVPLPENSLKEVSQGTPHGAPIICSPSLRYHCSSIPDVQCLENHHFHHVFLHLYYILIVSILQFIYIWK